MLSQTRMLLTSLTRKNPTMFTYFDTRPWFNQDLDHRELNQGVAALQCASGLHVSGCAVVNPERRTGFYHLDDFQCDIKGVVFFRDMPLEHYYPKKVMEASIFGAYDKLLKEKIPSEQVAAVNAQEKERHYHGTYANRRFNPIFEEFNRFREEYLDTSIARPVVQAQHNVFAANVAIELDRVVAAEEEIVPVEVERRWNQFIERDIEEIRLAQDRRFIEDLLRRNDNVIRQAAPANNLPTPQERARLMMETQQAIRARAERQARNMRIRGR